MNACERCGDWSATQMVQGEELCVECATRAAKTLSAGRRASSLGFDYDELALMVEERDAELVRLTAKLAAMTERKDGWRRVSLTYRERLRELYPELREELAWTHRRQVNIANEDTKEWSMDRREARNGHTD